MTVSKPYFSPLFLVVVPRLCLWVSKSLVKARSATKTVGYGGGCQRPFQPYVLDMKAILTFQLEACTGESVCRMFNEVLASSMAVPKRVVSDNDPLFRYHQWKANLRICEIEEIKSIPEIPWSNPYVERLIGSTRRECIDQVLFWGENDLGRKLAAYEQYFNEGRVHESLDGVSPSQFRKERDHKVIDLQKYQWEKYCGGLFQVPIAS